MPESASANDDKREIWRVIPSDPRYLASSEGRVMKIPYLSPMHFGGFRNYGGEPSHGVWVERERRFIWCIDGHTKKVARLVCEAFHGPAPDDKPVCMHLDENSRNNRPDNLAWGTQKENLNAPRFLDYCRGRIGENNPFIKGRAA
jgi:hypothetical protein